MKRTIKYILASCMMVLAMGVSAQGFRSAYFLDGYVYRHEMNPAFMGERNYVAIPILGNMNIGAQSNVGLSNFIYKYNDPMGLYSATTFMHPSVDANEFLGSLHDRNTINLNISMPVLSLGFYKWGGFNTIGLNLRVNQNNNLPYGMFEFLKNGQTSETTKYHFEDLNVRGNAYMEMAFGHSREIDNKLTVGAKLKFLFGVANTNVNVNSADILMSDDKWMVRMQGEGDLSMKNTTFKTKAVDLKNGGQRQKIDDIDVDSFSPMGGFGMGIDLGATYKMDALVEGLTLSAAVLDLGFISWNHTISGYNDGSVPFEFEGFKNIQVKDDESGDGSKSLDDQFDDLKDDLENMYQFYDRGVVSKRTTALNATVNIGAQYVLPYYKKLSFGFLSTTHFNKPFTWTEGRFSANIAPIKWLDASVNYGISTYGSSFGWVLNFHPKGFNFFVGSDHMMFKVNPQFVPIHNLNANVTLGFNVTFGEKPNKKVAKK